VDALNDLHLAFRWFFPICGFIFYVGLPQHVRDVLPGMDWLGSEFTPSPLIDPHHTFLASLILVSKFLLDKVFSNKARAM
jgi:hypothetical protein